MVDITPELILCRLKEVWANMADRLEELVYTDESKEMVDIINVLLIGWILLGLIVYIVGNIIANQLYKSKKKEETPEAAKEEEPAVIKEEQPVTAAKPPLPTECLNHKLPSITVNDSKATTKEHVTPQPTTIVPSAAGVDPDSVAWVNSILTWLYGQPTLDSLADAWIHSLNEKSQEQGTIHLNFEQVEVDCQPQLTDIKVDLSSEDKVTLTGKITAGQINFTVSSIKESGTTQYNVVVNNLCGKLKVDATVEELLFKVYFSEHPEFKTSVKSQSTPSTPTGEKAVKRDALIEVINKSIATAVVQIDVSNKDDFPQFQKTKPGIDFSKVDDEQVSEKLILKSIKASNLGGSKGCVEPYCVIELDDPGQKFETLAARNTNSPLWDHPFTFKLNNISSELLFELFDKGKDKDNFLGLGIISLEELSKNSSQRQVIPLQSRPLEKDEVTGAITVEFSFVDGEGHSLTGVRSGRIIEKNSRVTPGGTIITTTTIKRTVDGKVDASVISPATEKLDPTPNGEVPQQIEHDIKFSLSKNTVDEPAINSSQNNAFDASQADPILHSLTSCLSLSDTLLNSENSMQKSCAVENISSPVSNSISHPLVPPSSETPSLEPVVSVPASTSSDVPHNGMTDAVETEEKEEAALVDSAEVKPDLSPTDVETVGEESLTDTALRELENHGKSGVPASISTLIIHSVARETARPPVKVKLDKNGKWHEVSQDSPGKSSSGSVPSSPPSKQEGSSTLASTSSSASERDEAHRSRPKEKRSLMGTLRRRLSLKKTRSKSMEQKHDKEPTSQASSRSASADRSRSMPGSRETSSLRSSGKNYLNVPGSRAENDSTRSSISEASGISSCSTKTYISEKSTLVIEANENGVIKRYLIPASLATRSKWRKKGLKLHVYNDHIFVAKHLSGTVTCEVCNRRLSRRPGKQGYECRDCHLQCHKPCHVKVEGFCPNSTINTMEVEYVQDTSKPKKS